MTPSQNPNRAGQRPQRVTHPYGPPPNHPCYSSNPGIRRRSSNPVEASTSLYGSPLLPIANGQPLSVRLPVGTGSEFQTQAELCGTTPNESRAVHGEETLQNASSFRYSSFNGFSNVNNADMTFVPRQNISDYSPPVAGIDIRHYRTQQAQGALEPASLQFRNHNAPGPQLESHLKDSKSINVYTNHDTFHPMRSTISGETSQNSPPKTPTYSPMANTTDAVGSAESAARIKKVEIPHLSFTDAKRLRDSRCALLPEHENLLNDLKGRDHVSITIPYSFGHY